MKNPEIEQKLIHCIKKYNNHNSLYWYPLVPVEQSLSVAAYDIAAIYQHKQIHLLENLAKACNIGNVLMFQMDHREYFGEESIVPLFYEQDEDGYIFPWYSETFLFDHSEKWLIYLSHEHTITFTGEELAAAAKQIIPLCYFIS